MEISTRADFGKLLAEKGMLDAVAEVGVAEGRYSREILSWGVSTLYLVDLWESVAGVKTCPTAEDQDANYRACLKIAADHPGRVMLLRGWSHEMAAVIPDDSLGMCHLDCCHEYEAVRRDLEAYYPKLLPGGIMSGHDYLNPAFGVKRAVGEFTEEHGLDAHAIDVNRPSDACFWFEKPGEA
jgi:hypothetical protein